MTGVAAKRRTRGGQGPATEPSHRVDRVQGRGQEEDKRRTRPSHRVDRVQGRGQDKDKRRTRPSHRGQEEDKATQS